MSEGDFFIGARLSARRQKLGIPLEKAAKDIRVSVSRLSQIEVDDFSSFSHPTYTRLFLVDYANYLRVPLEEIRDYLPGSKRLGTTDNNYLEVLLARQTFLHGDQFKSLRRLLIGVGAGILLLILIGAGIYFWRAWQKLERVQSVAMPTPSPTPVTVPKPPASKYRTSPAQIATPDVSRTVSETSPTPAPKPSPTPFTLPPFETAPRPKRPQ